MNGEYQDTAGPGRTMRPQGAPGRQKSPYAHLQRFGIYLHPASVVKCRNVSIGEGTRINGPIMIKGVGSCAIGKYCAFGDDIHIITSNHLTGYANMQDGLQQRLGFKNILAPKGVVEIGANVWIGDNALVLSGVRIGHGAVVGAGSVITKDVPDYAIVAGSPARELKKRFSESIIAQMLELAWWDWPEEKMARNQAFFETDFALDPDLDIASIVVE